MTLRELLGTVCARWRMLLLCAIVFAVALGGYRTYSGIKNLSDGAAAEKALEANRLERRQYENKKEMLAEEIRQLELKESQANRYNENSLLMQLDPYNKDVAQLTFSVNADMAALAQDVPESWQIPTSVDLKAEREDRIVDQYLILANGISINELMAGTDYAQIGDQYLRELVYISKYAPGIVTFEAYTTKYVSGIDLAERLYEYCLAKQAAIAAIAGAHTVELVDAGSVVRIDLSLADAQMEAQKRPIDISLQLSDKTKELAELEEPPALALMTSATAIMGSVKYGLLGAFVGLCIGAVSAFLIETMGTNFKSGAAMAQALSSHYLGNLSIPQKKSGLDSWAERLLGEDIFSTVAAEDRLPLLAVNIKKEAGDKRNLLITGIHAQNELEKLRNDLQQHLGNEYQLLAAANLLVNRQAIQQLKDVEGAVMVEGAKTAQVERVMRTKQYLEEAECTLVGVVWA